MYRINSPPTLTVSTNGKTIQETKFPIFLPLR